MHLSRLRPLRRAGVIVALGWLLCTSHVSAEQRNCQGSSCVQTLPGFSCPPAKLWDHDASGKIPVCVDCRGAQPAAEQRNVVCPSTQVGYMLEGRDYFCQANAWRPGPWQLVTSTCRCEPPLRWDPERERCSDFSESASFLIHSTGLRWSNGAQPYWNSLINKLNAAIGPSWYSEQPPANYVRQAVDYLAAMIDPANRQGCPIEAVSFGNVTARCEIYREDIVSTPWQRGPFYVVSLWLGRS